MLLFILFITIFCGLDYPIFSFRTVSPNNALTLNEELIGLRKRIREQYKEIRRLKEENEFLEEASAFFASSRRKPARNKD